MFQILVIDDDPAIQLILTRVLQKEGYDVTVASDGQAGISQIQESKPALILCDWVMPVMNGLKVCRWVKANPNLSTTFFILLTSLGSIDDRVRGLDAGADDFISKPIEINELKARVRAGLRLHQLSRDLQAQKQILEMELSEAADYVRSLLPPPISGSVTIDSRFLPCQRLGGDCFDYYWLDSDRLAIYLLDASGHGMRATLPSISVLHLLRSRALPQVNYSQPSDVLKALNNTFQMNANNDKYFTIWYGVYNLRTHQLLYASAGHPPAILLSRTSTAPAQATNLKTRGVPIGMFPTGNYTNGLHNIEKNSTLYLFSDGVYEINQSDGKLWSLSEFINFLKTYPSNRTCNLDAILSYIQSLNGSKVFDDDLSILKIDFRL